MSSGSPGVVPAGGFADWAPTGVSSARGLAAAGLLVPAPVLDRVPDDAGLARVPVTAVFGRVRAVGTPGGGGPASSGTADGAAGSAARAAFWSSSARAAR
jgi:hypothetical protein